MAQLKDTIVSGNLRVTDTAIANTVQVTTIKAPTSSGGTSYGPGTSGQVLKSNGTSVYWTSDSNTDTKVDQVLNSDNKNRPLLMANAETSSTTATVNSSTIRNNSIYANASTGYILAKGFKSTLSTAAGFILTDSTGNEYGGVYDNGTNFWIGSTGSASYHHKGGTYISTGYSGTLPTTVGDVLNGNNSISVSIPKYTATSATSGTWTQVAHEVLHKGNHPATAPTTDTTSTASPTLGSTFTAVDSVTRDSSGHVTKLNTKTVTLPMYYKRAFVYDDSGDFGSYPWHKFAETTITTAYLDKTITFLVAVRVDGSLTSRQGILTAHVRASGSKTWGSGEFGWNLAGYNIDPTDFVMVYTNTANTSVKIELYVKQTAQYRGYLFDVLKEHDQSIADNSWDMVTYTSSAHGIAALPAGTGQVVSEFKNIQSNGFVVYNSTFKNTLQSATLTADATQTLPAVSGTILNTGNTAALCQQTGTVGGTGRPVYLNSGTITQCSVPASGAWWNTSNIFVPQVSTAGVVEIGRYLDFHATHASTNNYDVRIDAADTGTMYLYSNATGPNFRIRGTLPSLNFVQDTTDAAYNATTCGIVAYPGSTSGVNMVMQSGGNVFVGGGESVTKVYGCIIDAETNPYVSDNWINREKLFLTADEDIYISTSAGSISSEAHTDWTDLKSWVFTSSGDFRPTVNDKSSLGTSSYYWHSSYVTNMHANYAEIASNTLPLLVLNRNGSTNGAFIQFKNTNGILGYIGMSGAADGGLVRMDSTATSTSIIHDQDNTTGIGHYCTCDTAATTLAKVATTVSTDTTFKLVTGVSVTVKFTNAHTASGTATLNVNGTGAKNISHIGDSDTSRYFWNAKAVVDFVYDGTQWIIQHGGTATTTYWGLTKLNSSLTSTSTSYAATASTVKTLNDTKLNNNTQTVLYNAGHPTINALTSAITLSSTTFGVYKLLIIKYSDVDVSNGVSIYTTYDFIIPCDYLKSLGTSGKYTAGSELGISSYTDGLILEARYLSDTSIGLHIMAGPGVEVLDFTSAKVTILGVV